MQVILKPFVEEQMKRIRQADPSRLLSEQAADRIYQTLLKAACFVMNSTFQKMLSDEAVGDNPLAAWDPALLTTRQREETTERIHARIAAGELVLPQPLVSLLRIHLEKRADAIAEMLRRLTDYREQICRQILDGRIYTVITDISMGAGDTHRQGRSVGIVTTDAGKFVYKPRDMRGEEFLCGLLGRYLPDMVCVPACHAFEDRFGVASFIEKKRARGHEEARSFYRNFGGLAAMLKALGSTDMHVENILCHGIRPSVVDLETLLSPVTKGEKQQPQNSLLYLASRNSVYYTTLLPRTGPGEYEYSALMNRSEDGCAPEVDGAYTDVLPYLDQFVQGYQEAYQRIFKSRDKISRELQEAAPVIMIRVLLANSQEYLDVQKKMYSSRILADSETFLREKTKMLERMQKVAAPSFVPLLPDIFSQLLYGDIPYFYLMADSVDLMTGSKVAAAGFYAQSPLEHALEILDQMSDADEAFDEQLLRKSLEQYPARAKDINIAIPEPGSAVLSRQEAEKEAEELFALLCSLAVRAPSGRLLWGQLDTRNASFKFCDMWLAMGISGIAVFTAALQAVTDNPDCKAQAEHITKEILEDLDRQLDLVKDSGRTDLLDVNPGEAGGAGGLLSALALIRRYAHPDAAAHLQEKLLAILRKSDTERWNNPGRIGGISSLLSSLCRFEEYRSETGIIRKAADRLLALKQLTWHDQLLWQSFADRQRPISGAGHGHAGIADALYKASQILHHPGYMPAVREALRFECGIYSRDFETWPDLRVYPPVGFMHGYCSGAPGIGIMVRDMQNNGCKEETLQQLEQLAAAAADKISLRERDHLCCGNSAVAEYYMFMGDYKKAGRILLAMKERKDRTGSYQYQSREFRNTSSASFFYGVSGIAYEMLRYAFPDSVLSIF